MKSFKGISVSKGIKIGKAYRYSKTKLIVESYQIDSSEVEAELERLSRAKSRANDYLNNIKEKAAQELGSKETQIFDAHIYMLNDPVLNQEIREIIKNDKINAESAVDKAISKVSDKFMVLNDEYFKERIKDVQDVGNHLIRALTGELMTLHNIPVNSIIIAEDLTPSETTLLDKERLEGFVLEKGGETSHTAIMAKSLMLPAVINAEDILDEVKQGETIILDAVKGEVFVNPEQDIVSYYQEKIKKYHREQQSLLELREKPARTKDGKIVEIAGNIASEKELSTAKEVNADGIGLFRTEFLYMNKANLTDEERQFKIYKKVLKQMSPKPVVIRTLDIGGDKDLPYFRGPEEVNPFLGWRG
ncbi:MAG: phosphoenolpyruvate--protein phosphotransferase, partial [Halanaerobiales bacterium]